MSTALFEFFSNIVGEQNVLLSEPMSKHTTFRVGGEAEYFVNINSRESLVKIMKMISQVGREFFVLGKGSNLLVSDSGYEGVVLNMGDCITGIAVSGTRLTVQAGTSLAEVARVAAEHGLTGFEFASGIPGTMGGAVVMNAGAYDGEMSQVIQNVTVVTYDGEIMDIDNNSMEFGYRTSAIKKKPFVVLEAVINLQQGDRETILARMAELNSRRREKQPLEFPSAGSTFKRPEGFFAGKLIMDAGLSGMTIVGAKVSEKHCGFIINTGKATAADILDCIHEVQDKVQHDFHVELEPEVCILGEF